MTPKSKASSSITIANCIYRLKALVILMGMYKCLSSERMYFSLLKILICEHSKTLYWQWRR